MLVQWKRVLEVDCNAGPCCELEDPDAPYWQLREGPRPCMHGHYIALQETFMGSPPTLAHPHALPLHAPGEIRSAGI